MFLGEFFEIVGENFFHRLAENASWQSLDLQQETFLKASATNACRVEGLEDVEHMFNLLLRYVYVVIDGKLIADAV